MPINKQYKVGETMRATARDVYEAITVRNILIFTAIVGLSIVLIDVLGYIVWRRFPIPSLIVTVAVLGWKIGRKIGHLGLSRVLNAASVGLGCFGVALWGAAITDGWYFAERGYISWLTTMTMWAWVTLHVWRAWRVLRSMPPDKLIHVTEGTEVIYAQMTYRHARAKEVLKAYEDVTRLHLVSS